MSMNRIGVTVGLVTACLLVAHCGGSEREHRDRELTLVQHDDDTTVEAAAIVRRQRDLFAALSARRSIGALATQRFTVRNDRSMTLSDSSIAAQRRQAVTLEALNARPPLDTSVIAEAGDLMAYTDFQTYPLSASQIVVVARDEHGSTVFTNWIRSGADWQATGMVLNPSQTVFARLHERWSQL